jgi:hypothetical protein
MSASSFFSGCWAGMCSGRQLGLHEAQALALAGQHHDVLRL